MGASRFSGSDVVARIQFLFSSVSYLVGLCSTFPVFRALFLQNFVFYWLCFSGISFHPTTLYMFKL